MELPDVWKACFRGKRVCLVGNAPEPWPPNLPIDEHDVIVRFNDCVRGGSWGSLTSIYCTTLRKEVRTDPRQMQAEGIPVVFTGSKPDGESKLAWKFVGVDLEPSLGCWPSSGLMAVCIAMACQASHITLAAFTLAPPLARDPAWPPRYAPPWAYHNFLGERRMLARMLRDFKGSVELPASLQSLRHPAFNQPNPHWKTLAQVLASMSQDQTNNASQDSEFIRLMGKRLQWLSCELSLIEPSIQGVSELEPYFYLPKDTLLHCNRWMLFDPNGTRFMDGFLARLRTLQISKRYPESNSHAEHLLACDLE